MRTTTKAKKDSLAEMGKQIRVLTMEMSARSRSGETGSSLSISDLLAVLYWKILRIDPRKPNDLNRDRFLLSKGHAAAGLYAALALRGFFPLSVLEGHRMNGGKLHAHPSRGAVPGVEISTGSLGHGLSVGVGMREALQKSRARVFVLLGDGECDEGSVWEAAHYAGSHAMKNLVAIVDDNKFQGYPLKLQKKLDLVPKWKAFGWDAVRVNGHDVKEIEKALARAMKLGKPAVVIADTIAGKDVPEVAKTHHAHYYVPDAAAVEKMKKKYAH